MVRQNAPDAPIPIQDKLIRPSSRRRKANPTNLRTELRAAFVRVPLERSNATLIRRRDRAPRIVRPIYFPRTNFADTPRNLVRRARVWLEQGSSLSERAQFRIQRHYSGFTRWEYTCAFFCTKNRRRKVSGRRLGVAFAKLIVRFVSGFDLLPAAGALTVIEDFFAQPD